MHILPLPMVRDGVPRPLHVKVFEARPELRDLAERVRPVPVDAPLANGARLDVAGGLRLVASPGHTVGHASV